MKKTVNFFTSVAIDMHDTPIPTFAEHRANVEHKLALMLSSSIYGKVKRDSKPHPQGFPKPDFSGIDEQKANLKCN